MRPTLLFACALSVAWAVPHSTPLTLPVRFEPVGSSFLARAPGSVLELAPDRARLLRSGFPVGFRFAGTPGLGRPVGESALAAQSHHFNAAGRRSAPLFSQVRYRNLYPGIDLLFHGQGGRLEHDWILAPGADPRRIALDIEGTPQLLAGGSLEIRSGESTLRWGPPHIFQGAQAIAGRYRLKGRRVTYEIGPYDPTRTLVIDPTLDYVSYLGGNGNEGARIAVDGAGNIYLAGYTTSQNLAISRTALQTGYGGHTSNRMTGDGFVARINANGTLGYLTYLGGDADDVITSLAVDAAGNAYVTGYTNSGNFPTTTGAYQTRYGGGGGNNIYRAGDAFVAKLNPAGSELLYSTLLGGNRDDTGMAITIDGAGNAYVAGVTLSTNFAVTEGAVQRINRGSAQIPFPRYRTPLFLAGDLFITKLNPQGTGLVFSTYLGGTSDEAPLAIAVDTAGSVYVGGYTISGDYPVSANAFQKTFRGTETENPFFSIGDGFVTKLNATGTQILASTFLGGLGDEMVTALAVDTNGTIVAAGSVTARDFPTTANAPQRAYRGPTTADSEIDFIIGDAFVTRLNADASQVLFSTYLGGGVDDIALGVALDGDGNIYLAGTTSSPNFPVTADAAQRTYGGGRGQFVDQPTGDGFVAVINASGQQTYGTFLGGARDEILAGMAFDRNRNLYVSGVTVSDNLPVSANALQRSFGGRGDRAEITGDAFVMRLSGFGVTTPPTAGALSALTNAASGVPNAASPGMVFVVYGNPLGPKELVGAGLAANGRLDTRRGDTQILFDNIPAPIVYVSETQSAGIVPYAMAGRATAQVVVEYRGQRTPPLAVRIAPVSLGVFTANQSGSGPGAISNQDGQPNSPASPAAKGSIVVVFLTGEGQTVPAGVDGQVAATVFPKPTDPVTATVAGQTAEILYSGAAPGQTAGLMQVNLRVPAGAPSGNQSVVIQVGANRSQPNVTVAVE